MEAGGMGAGSDGRMGGVSISMCLLAERASLRESRFAPRRLTQHSVASSADDDCLCMREDGCDLVTTWTLDVHEVAVR